MRTRIKFCGITNAADAACAVEAGADAIGIVFAKSKRRVKPRAARTIAAEAPPLVSVVGVWMDQPLDEIRATFERVRLTAIQLHGSEPPAFCKKVIAATGLPIIKRLDPNVRGIRRLADEYEAELGPAVLFLLDPGAGDGQTFDWSQAKGFGRMIALSGGLNPRNVAAAIRTVRPLAVDVSSGVESEPGRKDARKLRAFARAVRRADG